MAQWLALHSSLGYVVLKFMLGWVRTILPSRFHFKFEKRSPNWGPRNLHKECAHPNGWRDKHTHTFEGCRSREGDNGNGSSSGAAAAASEAVALPEADAVAPAKVVTVSAATEAETVEAVGAVEAVKYLN